MMSLTMRLSASSMLAALVTVSICYAQEQQTPVVRDADGVVRKGNGTLQAARILGWSHIAVADSTLRGRAAEMYAVADNRSGDAEVGSEWDDVALAEFLAELQADPETDATATGFEALEIQNQIDLAMAELGGDVETESRGVEVKESYGVLVTCQNEADQRAVYTLMHKRGYRCRVVTL